MSIQECFRRTDDECAADGLCLLQPSARLGARGVCVPSTCPPVLSAPAGISDPEIELLKRIIVSLSSADVSDGVVNELREMYPPLVHYVNKKIRSEVAGAGDNVPWGTMAERLSRTILNEIRETTCTICLSVLNDREDRTSLVFPTCCEGRQVLHKRCFRDAIEQTGRCPTCRKNVTMQQLENDEGNAYRLEIDLLPFIPRWSALTNLSAQEFGSRLMMQVGRHVEHLNAMWERVQPTGVAVEERLLSDARSRRRAAVWAERHLAELDHEELRENINGYDAEITQRVHRILVLRRSMGMATTGPNGSVQLQNGLVALLFCVMGILSVHLIYDTVV